LKTFKPKTEPEIAELVLGATQPFEICGSGTKRGLGRALPDLDVLSLAEFSTVKSYEPEELVLDVGAGARVADVETLLATKGQHLAFEPADYSTLLGTPHKGTMGGLLACNLSGPRRIKAGAARDHILGLSAVSGRGEIFKAGARVVKNVTGYDVPKLMAGSYGTLAIFTSVIFKVLPKPETENTIFIAGLSDAEAVNFMSMAMQSPYDISGVAHIPESGTYFRLEGIEASVAYRRQKLLSLLSRKCDILTGAPSTDIWIAVRDVLPLCNPLNHCIWRLSVAPSEAPTIIENLKRQFDFKYYFDWAGGLVWLAVDGDHSTAIRAALAAGHATLMRATAEMRNSVPVFQPQETALAALSGRVKNSFDPRAIFNPARMYEGM
jgi:glycolate oxidase FAD binding subunit